MITMAKTTKYRGTENKPLAQAMHGLRSSSAASPHTPKKFKGTRGNQSRKAIREFA